MSLVLENGQFRASNNTLSQHRDRVNMHINHIFSKVRYKRLKMYSEI